MRKKGGIVIIPMVVVSTVAIRRIINAVEVIKIKNDKIRIKTKIKKIMKMTMKRKVPFY